MSERFWALEYVAGSKDVSHATRVRWHVEDDVLHVIVTSLEGFDELKTYRLVEVERVWKEVDR